MTQADTDSLIWSHQGGEEEEEGECLYCLCNKHKEIEGTTLPFRCHEKRSTKKKAKTQHYQQAQHIHIQLINISNSIFAQLICFTMSAAHVIQLISQWAAFGTVKALV